MTKWACIVRQNPYPADSLAHREAKALHDDGFQVDVICLRTLTTPAEEVINEIHVYRLSVPQGKGGFIHYMAKYALFFVLAALKLTALHWRHRYSLIQVNNLPDFLVFATLVPKLTGAKIGLVMYEPMPELWTTLYNKQYLIRFLEIVQRLAISYADVVFAVTQQQKETFVARGAPADKVTVMLNVPDTYFWEQYIPQTSRPKEQFVLICHGAIEERYGHDTMLQAVQRVKDQIPGLRLCILGTGSYRDQFLAQIKAMGLETTVQYLGWVSVSQMVEELYHADVGIVAQKSSLYSNLVHTGKMYDFLAFGKPVLATRLKSVQAYFGEDALRFFEPGDPESLAKGILDLYQHPEKRQALVENSQKLYNQYKWENQKQVYLSTYRTLTG